MTIAQQIRARQDTKEMTRRAIRALLAINPDDAEGIALRDDFERTYNETL